MWRPSLQPETAVGDGRPETRDHFPPSLCLSAVCIPPATFRPVRVCNADSLGPGSVGHRCILSVNQSVTIESLSRLSVSGTLLCRARACVLAYARIRSLSWRRCSARGREGPGLVLKGQTGKGTRVVVTRPSWTVCKVTELPWSPGRRGPPAVQVFPACPLPSPA